MHHVRAYNLRDRQLSGQKFKVNRFNVVHDIEVLLKVFPLVLCHLLHAVHGDR